MAEDKEKGTRESLFDKLGEVFILTGKLVQKELGEMKEELSDDLDELITKMKKQVGEDEKPVEEKKPIITPPPAGNTGTQA